MAKLQAVRGTHDLLGDEARRHLQIIEKFAEIAERFSFVPVATPVFEFTEVFARTLGESSDVVAKEMYSFEDRGGDSLTLRPEYTAGIARAYLSSGWQQYAPLKLYAAGPMFRYERPQKGRFRQFHQIDAEILGAAEPQADIELIAMAALLLEELGLKGDVELLLNTLGDPESRRAYRAALVDYFSDHKSALSEDSRERLDRNPLRILDSKDPRDRALLGDAPLIDDYLTREAADFFAAVREGLDALGVAYALDPRLVRGLDYYTHTAFEFVTDALGAQGTVIGGGRYDGLMEQMGGPATPCVGWAGGIERLAMMLRLPEDAARPIAVIPIGAVAEPVCLKLAHDLRRSGFAVAHDLKGNVKKRMKRANDADARYACLIGEDEVAEGRVTVKDLDSGAQQSVELDGIAEWFKTR